MFKTLLSKEILESIRTWRMIILIAVLMLSGLVSPVLAKYLPQLLSSIPDIPPGLTDLIPEPRLRDAIMQYVENIAQFGALLVILLNMGAVAGEKERGTAAMLISKPVHRSTFLLAKWVAGLVAILVGLILAGVGGWAYTTVLFEAPSVSDFLILNLLIAVFFAIYLSTTLLASTLAHTQSAAALGAFASLVFLLIWGAIPRLNDYAPGKLLDWGQSYFLGGEASAWGALGVAAVLIIVAFTAAAFFFNREEI
jgi:ABC-2 type transport system permease protein